MLEISISSRCLLLCQTLYRKITQKSIKFSEHKLKSVFTIEILRINILKQNWQHAYQLIPHRITLPSQRLFLPDQPPCKTKNPRAGRIPPTLGNSLFSSLFQYSVLYLTLCRTISKAVILPLFLPDQLIYRCMAGRKAEHFTPGRSTGYSS